MITPDIFTRIASLVIKAEKSYRGLCSLKSAMMFYDKCIQRGFYTMEYVMEFEFKLPTLYHGMVIHMNLDERRMFRDAVFFAIKRESRK